MKKRLIKSFQLSPVTPKKVDETIVKLMKSITALLEEWLENIQNYNDPSQEIKQQMINFVAFLSTITLPKNFVETEIENEKKMEEIKLENTDNKTIEPEKKQEKTEKSRKKNTDKAIEKKALEKLERKIEKAEKRNDTPDRHERGKKRSETSGEVVETPPRQPRQRANSLHSAKKYIKQLHGSEAQLDTRKLKASPQVSKSNGDLFTAIKEEKPKPKSTVNFKVEREKRKSLIIEKTDKKKDKESRKSKDKRKSRRASSHFSLASPSISLPSSSSLKSSGTPTSAVNQLLAALATNDPKSDQVKELVSSLTQSITSKDLDDSAHQTSTEASDLLDSVSHSDPNEKESNATADDLLASLNQPSSVAANDLLASLGQFDSPVVGSAQANSTAADDLLASLHQLDTIAAAPAQPAADLLATLNQFEAPENLDFDLPAESNSANDLLASLNQFENDTQKSAPVASAADDLLASLNQVSAADDLLASLNQGSSANDDLLASLQPLQKESNAADDLLASLGRFGNDVQKEAPASAADDLLASLNQPGAADLLASLNANQGPADDLLASLNQFESPKKDAVPVNDLLASLNQFGNEDSSKDSNVNDLLASLNQLDPGSTMSFEVKLSELKDIDINTNLPSTSASFDISGLDSLNFDSKSNDIGTNSNEITVEGLSAPAPPAAAAKMVSYDDFFAAFSKKEEKPAAVFSPRGDKLIRAYALKEDANVRGMKRIKKKSVAVGLKNKGQYQMEDAHYIGFPFKNNKDMAVFAVFDGHVDKNAAEKAVKIFPDIFHETVQQLSLSNDIEQILHKSFLSTDDQLIEFEMEGTTATAVVIWKLGSNRYVQSANVGDSTAFLCREGRAIALSVDHKVNNPSEQKRLIQAGLKINQGQNRINGLAVSRALGDHFIKQNFSGVTAEPYVSSAYALQESDSILIVASDGLWDVYSGQEAMDLVKGMTDPQAMSNKLMNGVISSGKCNDNVTIIVVVL